MGRSDLPSGPGAGPGAGSLEGVSALKIEFEYINLHHFIKLSKAEHLRIDVGRLFREIEIF